MKFEDFGWDDIILEAPDNNESEEELTATDYSDADNLEINSVDEEELASTDTSNKDDDSGKDSTENNDEEENIDTNEDLEDEQNVNNDSEGIDSQQNKYLVHDFIELYTRITEILDKLRTDKKMSSFVNPSFKQVKMNIEKLRDVVYDYITDKFDKETYISNLYQFNLIIQALNINAQMLEEIENKINGGKK